MNDNRRKRTRVKLGASVDVHATGARLLGLKSRDLSHKGVYVLGDLPLNRGKTAWLRCTCRLKAIQRRYCIWKEK
jgi:hypothetical protein